MEAGALPGAVGPSAHLCPLVSLDAFVRMSRSQGDGEMGVCKENPYSATQGEGTGVLPMLELGQALCLPQRHNYFLGQESRFHAWQSGRQSRPAAARPAEGSPKSVSSGSWLWKTPGIGQVSSGNLYHPTSVHGRKQGDRHRTATLVLSDRLSVCAADLKGYMGTFGGGVL